MVSSSSKMEFKKYLISLQWRSFSNYPDQGSSIYLHCFAESIHKFVKVQRFNAVNFDFQKFTQKFTEKLKWQFSWLPAQQVDNDYDNRTNGGSVDDGHSPDTTETGPGNSETVCNSGSRRRKSKTIPKRSKSRYEKKMTKT